MSDEMGHFLLPETDYNQLMIKATNQEQPSQHQSSPTSPIPHIDQETIFNELKHGIELFKWVDPQIFNDQFVNELYRKAVAKVYPTKNPTKRQAKKRASLKKNNSNPPPSRRSKANAARNKAIEEQLQHTFKPPPDTTSLPQTSSSFRPRNKRTHPSKTSQMLSDFWNSTTDQALITSFIAHSRFTNIVSEMNDKYPQHHLLFTRQRIRSRVYSLLRCGLRKLGSMRLAMKSMGGPELVSMNHTRNHLFMYHQGSKDVKNQLLEFYLTDKMKVKEFKELIEGVNRVIREAEVESVEREEVGVREIEEEQRVEEARRKRRKEGSRRREKRSYRKRIVDEQPGEGWNEDIGEANELDCKQNWSVEQDYSVLSQD